VKAETLDLLRRGAPEAERWPHARRLFEHQRALCPDYAALVGAADPRTFAELPAAPVGLFRDLRFCVTASSGAVFRTSGTTSGQRGAHHLPDTEAVELAARQHFDAMLPGCPTDRTISLVTDANEHPDSSLGHMVRHLAPSARGFFRPGVGVDTQGAWAALDAAREPVFVPTTAFALAELLEHPGEARLPEGSIVMVTGGFKGRRAQLDEAGLWAEAQRRFGPEARLVGEYGMTELSSQLWDVGAGYVPPPWLIVIVVDPETGAPLPDGSLGLLRFVDLASWGSCVAIETQDLGVLRDGRLRLQGRVTDAPARGCSLTAEEAMAPR
jgi:hypothetical protein